MSGLADILQIPGGADSPYKGNCTYLRGIRVKVRQKEWKNFSSVEASERAAIAELEERSVRESEAQLRRDRRHGRVQDPGGTRVRKDEVDALY